MPIPDRAATSPAPPASSTRAPQWICSAIIAVFALLLPAMAYHAGASRSPTYDESIHLVGAMTQSSLHDYRHNFADPPLWKHWMALALPQTPLPTDDQRWTQMPEDYGNEWSFAWQALYNRSIDPMPAFRRGQLMIALLAGALVVSAAAFAWRLAGPAAGAIAAGLIAVCPTTLALGGIVKNDVPIALALVLVAFAGWAVGQRLTLTRVLLLGVACGVAATTKFSGVLAAPIVAALLIGRALMPLDWPTFRAPLRSIGLRLVGAVSSGIVVAFLMVAVIWAAYGFRYRAVNETARPLALASLATEAVRQREQLKDIHTPFTTEQAALLPHDRFSRLVLWIDANRLLPEAFNAGLLFVHAFSAMRDSFALGEVRSSGTWWYFPFAILVKTPVALLLAWAVGIGIGIDHLRRRGFRPIPWSALAVLLVLGILAVSLLAGRLNIGVRHALPLTAMLSIAAACGLAILARQREMMAVPVILVVLAGLESFVSHPRQLAFFNIAARSFSDPIALLGDSNLDWGQDLPELARWHQANPNVPIYLSYFGTADPAYYGIRYINASRGAQDGTRENFGGYVFGPPPIPYQQPPPGQWAVLAISASHLQGIGIGPEVYEFMRVTKPYAVLGDSIYLFALGQPPP